MKCIYPLLIFVLIVFSCNNPDDKGDKDPFVGEKQPTPRFFPVTAYIKGEIYTIKKNGINPLKHTIINGRIDSVWLKIEELDSAVKEFLYPEIDSTNLITLFIEKNFLDQSINAVTLTYEPIGTLSDTIHLQNWNVYIDPPSNKVKRIYIVKQINKSTTLQLTWVSNKWCKITTISTDEKGVKKIEKEEQISWDF